MKVKKLYRRKGRNTLLDDNGKHNYRWTRNKKRVILDEDGSYEIPGDRKMKRKYKDGYDYTPLYRFLHSRVGRDWDEVYSEAISKLPERNPKPIWHIVYHKNQCVYEDGKLMIRDSRGVISTPKAVTNTWDRYYSSSYWSNLYIDQENKLRFVDKDYKLTDYKYWYN